jgi:probable addiction module antidote protein
MGVEGGLKMSLTDAEKAARMKRIFELTTSYRDDLVERLRAEPEYAVGYLNAALEEGHGAFPIALKDVMDARFGMTGLAEQAELNREALYRALSEEGNPRLTTLEKILGALGLHLAVAAPSADRPHPKAD